MTKWSFVTKWQPNFHFWFDIPRQLSPIISFVSWRSDKVQEHMFPKNKFRWFLTKLLIFQRTFKERVSKLVFNIYINCLSVACDKYDNDVMFSSRCCKHEARVGVLYKTTLRSSQHSLTLREFDNTTHLAMLLTQGVTSNVRSCFPREITSMSNKILSDNI